MSFLSDFFVLSKPLAKKTAIGCYKITKLHNTSTNKHTIGIAWPMFCIDLSFVANILTLGSNHFTGRSPDAVIAMLKKCGEAYQEEIIDLFYN